jgi:hypothetical protein
MSRASSIMLWLATALAVFIIASVGPRPAWASTRKACGFFIVNCYKRCDKLPGGIEDCKDQCVNTYANCMATVPKDKQGGIDPGTTGDNPPKKWRPPVNVGVNPPVGGGATSPPKHPIGVHPITPINPVNPVGIDQPGSGSGSGTTTIYRSQRTGKH